MALQHFLGRFWYSSAAGSNDLIIDPAGAAYAINLTDGYYYISGYTAESTAQLCEHIQARIRAVLDGTSGKPDETAMTVIYDIVQQRVEFAWTNAHAMTLQSGIATVLGLATSQGSATAHNGTRQPRYVWIPGQGPSSHFVDQTQFWSPQSQTIYGRSASGACYSVQGTMLYHNELSYQLLSKSVVITPSSGTAYADFQQWYTDVLHAGQQFRIVLDASSAAYASTGYTTAIYGNGGQDATIISSFKDFASRHISNYQDLWDVTIPVIKYVDPT